MSMAKVAIIKEIREDPRADKGFRTSLYIDVATIPTRKNENGKEMYGETPLK